MFFYWWLMFLQEFYQSAAQQTAPAAEPATAKPSPAPAGSREQKLEEALARTQAALEVSERSRGAFLSAMSHELRTPLNAIMGFAEMMCKNVCGPMGNTTYDEYARHIHDSGGELLSKINDLLAISSMNANEFSLEESRFKLNELLAELSEVHSHAAFANGITLKFDAPGEIEVLADRAQVLCALAHLVSNALNHSGEGKEVIVSARIQGDEGLILSVRDAGTGIEPARLASIREALQKNTSYFAIHADGIGLGLSLARELAARHGGRLMIDSIRHKGTVVSFILPAGRIMRGMPVKRQRRL